MLDQSDYLLSLATYLRTLDEPPIVVHGGGPAIDQLQRRLGMEPVKVDGLRRSRGEELEAALMALCGSVNKRLVAGLVAAGLPAVGLSGVDGGMLHVKKLEHPTTDLGFVGEIARVDTAVIENLVEAGLTAVVAPLSLGTDGQIYNVNADQVASALARATGAETLDFVSDVPGILLDNVTVPQLSPTRARSLLDDDRVNGGMVPKILAAIEAIEAGVPQVRIADLPGLREEGGTVLREEAASDGSRKGHQEG